MTFDTKDSGQREQGAGGMVRDTTVGKLMVSLIRRGPMFQRWYELLERGAKKYTPDNWCLALDEPDLKNRDANRVRWLESAQRHFEQWLRGDRDEDHAAAVFFNINGFEAMVESEATPDLQERAIAHMRHVYKKGAQTLFKWGTAIQQLRHAIPARDLDAEKAKVTALLNAEKLRVKSDEKPMSDQEFRDDAEMKRG